MRLAAIAWLAIANWAVTRDPVWRDVYRMAGPRGERESFASLHKLGDPQLAATVRFIVRERRQRREAS